MIFSPTIYDAVRGLRYAPGDCAIYDAFAALLNLPGHASLAAPLHWLTTVAPSIQGPELLTADYTEAPYKPTWVDPLKHPPIA